MELPLADGLMARALGEGVFAGAVLLVAVGDTIRHHRAYGLADRFARRPMTLDTCFDLASLTKPLATTPVIMRLVADGGLDLNRSVGEVLPFFAGCDAAGVTIAQLLGHRAGLAPWRPWFVPLSRLPRDRRREGLQRLLMREPLVRAPGTRTEYSDLGFLLLQLVAEVVSGEGLDRSFQRWIADPLRIDTLFFRPATAAPAGERSRFAATQLCPWRRRLLVGEVDDENAHALGGVAGHAGLFGTAGAVHRLVAALMRAALEQSPASFIDGRTVARFFRREPGAECRALGFDGVSSSGSSSGRWFSRESIGHLGYTGTSFWADPMRSVIVVLLTNRVHPFRFNDRIREFRPRLHDAVMTALGMAPPR